MQDTSRSAARTWSALFVLHLLALVGLAGWIGWEARPVAMHDLRLAEGEKLKCVSYSPFHLPGQTPFDEALVIPRAQIAADLAALAKITDCVRLYSVDQGLDQVPGIARELGLGVLLGAWIGYDKKRNAVELDRAIALANEYRDVVRALIVGNEVLLRRERTADEMRTLIDYARARTTVPITYADVWEFWMRHDELAPAVDFVTVHILPFWEDEPVEIGLAIEHVAAVYGSVARHFEKPLLIGETGWPSAGRQREHSLPSAVNQARYIREFVHRAHAEGWNYNLIEAIDQPWKRRLEGTVGGYWGMLDVALAPKFPLAGPVAERRGLAPLVIAAAVGMLVALAAAWAAGRGPRPFFRLPALAAAGAVVGLIAVLHFEHALLAYRDGLEWVVLGGLAALAAALPPLLALWSGNAPIPAGVDAWRQLREAGPSAAARPPEGGASSPGGGGGVPQSTALRRRSRPAVQSRPWTVIAQRSEGSPVAARLLGLVRLVVLFAVTVAAVLLFADPRYRDFPILLYLAPALVFGVADWLAGERGLEERACSLILAVAVVGRWSSEPANVQAIGWLLVGLTLAAPALRRAPEQQQ